MLAAAWSAVTGFFWRYVAYIALAGAVALLVLAGVLWLQKSAAEKKLSAAQISIERLRVANDGLKLEVGDRDAAIAALERTNKKAAEDAKELADTLAEIAGAKPDENGPIAPVLDRLLRRFGRLPGK